MIHTFAASQIGWSIQYPAPPFYLVNFGNCQILTFRALAVEGVNLVNAFAIVQTGLAGTLVCVNVAEDTLVP